MADPATWLMAITGAVSTIGGIAGSSAAQQQSEAAYKASLEEKLRAYQANIGMTKYAGETERADIQREGEQFIRGQEAAIGASGATIGTGTPLMTMIDTAQTLELDMLRSHRMEKMQVEYMESEMGEIEKLLGINQPEKEKKPVKSKINTGGMYDSPSSSKSNI